MDFNKETPTRSFLIQGQTFAIPAPFVAGHTCSGQEAGVLNQILAENTRNNWAERVKKANEEGTFDQGKMQADIDEYLETYEFGVRRGRGPVDPVEREAFSMAKEIVRNALRQKGFKLADIDVEQINSLAEQAVEANPDITKEAKRRVEQRGKIAAESIDLSGLTAPEEAQEEAA